MRNVLFKNHRKVEIKCGQHVLKLGARTHIMGILNVTPDSFSDGGKFNKVDRAIDHAKEMVKQGADIIDVGGESTRPGYTALSEEEEISRLIPVIERLVKEINVPISVDTNKSVVAEAAINAGAHIINDIWGLQKDENMAFVAAKYNTPVIIMHNQDGTEYSKDIIEAMCDFFDKSIKIALNAGIKKENIIIDPGIGFGKTAEQNIEVMTRLGEFNDLGYPILLGTSRKSTIGKILDLPVNERVEGTLATSVLGVVQGIDIIRVHDIKENYRTIKVADAIVRGAIPWTK